MKRVDEQERVFEVYVEHDDWIEQDLKLMTLKVRDLLVSQRTTDTFKRNVVRICQKIDFIGELLIAETDSLMNKLDHIPGRLKEKKAMEPLTIRQIEGIKKLLSEIKGMTEIVDRVVGQELARQNLEVRH